MLKARVIYLGLNTIIPLPSCNDRQLHVPYDPPSRRSETEIQPEIMLRIFFSRASAAAAPAVAAGTCMQVEP